MQRKFWDRLWEEENGKEDFEKKFLESSDNTFSMKLRKTTGNYYYVNIEDPSTNRIIDSFWMYDFYVNNRPSEKSLTIHLNKEAIEDFMLNYFAKKYPEYKKEYVDYILKTKFEDENDFELEQ